MYMTITFQTSFLLNRPSRPIGANLNMCLVGKWEHKYCKNRLGYLTKMAAMPIYLYIRFMTVPFQN